jgi:hypothetical protein
MINNHKTNIDAIYRNNRYPIIAWKLGIAINPRIRPANKRLTLIPNDLPFVFFNLPLYTLAEINNLDMESDSPVFYISISYHSITPKMFSEKYKMASL